ncbi:MAG: N-6 DNA methylase [Solirubrobacteraceae bacterium]|nr:N-6 DNA methylase [Solirubrobacteraceae bacterium]
MKTVPKMLPGDRVELRKRRGAFFTPLPIAEFLVDWALAGAPEGSRVLDPTCGEGVFLLAAAENLRRRGVSAADMAGLLYGVDLHEASLRETRELLGAAGPGAELRIADFFDQPTPAQPDAELPWMDAVVGNPPFVRYHDHRGDARKRSVTAALRQGVRLSGLASSWAALLVHAASFLKPEGRIAMVLPAELLTVGYAEPIRRWLSARFARVHLVLFDELQFPDADEQVVLLIAQGTGGCDAFGLHQVRDATELRSKHLFDADPVALGAPEDKWTDLLLPVDRRNLFRRVTAQAFTGLESYGRPELGTVTGANSFFTLSEKTRKDYKLPPRHLLKIVPPGARHIRGTSFSRGQWEELREAGQRVWMLHPEVDKPTGALATYLAVGEHLGVPDAYKCSVRSTWWRPPAVSTPDLFFTYMSHTSPRLVSNGASATIVNSLHGITLVDDAPGVAQDALPLLTLNSATMLGAELYGRSYGGGILKMEPREAARLPVPSPTVLVDAWGRLRPRAARLGGLVRAGGWREALSEVDDVLLHQTIGLSLNEVAALRGATTRLRQRRTRKTSSDDG